MNEMIQEAVLDSIDSIDEAQLFAEFDVLISMAEVYSKAAMIQEASGLEFDGYSVIQEADSEDTSEKVDKKSDVNKKSKFAWLKNILTVIGKAFRFLARKAKHLIRVILNIKSDKLIVFHYKFDHVMRASEALVDASEHLGTLFETRFGDTNASNKLKHSLDIANKAINKSKTSSYKETVKACEPYLKDLLKNVETAQEKYDSASKKIREFADQLSADAYKPKADQKLQADDNFKFNISYQAMLKDYANVLKQLTAITTEISASFNIKANDQSDNLKSLYGDDVTDDKSEQS